ncbi:MAG: multicopper oxidase domain-containing protein [Bacteroidia bacterium]
MEKEAAKGKKNYTRYYTIAMHEFVHDMGFTDIGTGQRLTPMIGYGPDNSATGMTYPGKTFVEKKDVGITVKWKNRINIGPHPLPVDTSMHWCYSLHNYTQYSIANDGIPVVPHVHGGHTESQSDGNPEFFFSPDWVIKGPQWVQKGYNYDNDQPAGTLWYHDHALGITRLNVYAGMAGFYILRDDVDTGEAGNPLGLPVFPYEGAFAIQDKFFNEDGTMFWPAFPGDPFYEDFIIGEEANLPESQFPGGGPTGLAEFFGDHIIVNGKLWPKMEVEPRNYRLRYLNGCDSRFLVIELYEVDLNETQADENTLTPIPFQVIGSDQGLATSPTTVTRLVVEPGSRYDLIVNFAGREGKRLILKNIAGDTPFGFSYGEDLEPEDIFGDPTSPRVTDRIMAFDVTLTLGELGGPADVWNPSNLSSTDPIVPVNPGETVRIRKVGLFEGKDEYGRLQPILGTAEPATDYAGNPIYWPETAPYIAAGLAYEADGVTRRQMNGAVAWHSPTTENPALDSVEEWQIYNVTGDSHPVHLHQVHFEILRRETIQWDSHTIGENDPSGEEEDRVIPNALYSTPAGDGTYLETQAVVQHNSGMTGGYGHAFRVMNATSTGIVVDMSQEPEYVENAPKDMVTARPNEITFIRARFDRPGRYVWHCHILSHEDHEMMRVMHVGPISTPAARLVAPEASVSVENYPNPFTRKTNFKVDLKQAGQMEIQILDTAGKIVRTIGEGSYNAGIHTLPMDASELAAGAYFYRVIIDGELAKSGKMIKS